MCEHRSTLWTRPLELDAVMMRRQGSKGLTFDGEITSPSVSDADTRLRNPSTAGIVRDLLARVASPSTQL